MNNILKFFSNILDLPMKILGIYDHLNSKKDHGTTNTYTTDSVVGDGNFSNNVIVRGNNNNISVSSTPQTSSEGNTSEPPPSFIDNSSFKFFAIPILIALLSWKFPIMEAVSYIYTIVVLLIIYTYISLIRMINKSKHMNYNCYLFYSRLIILSIIFSVCSAVLNVVNIQEFIYTYIYIGYVEQNKIINLFLTFISSSGLYLLVVLNFGIIRKIIKGINVNYKFIYLALFLFSFCILLQTGGIAYIYKVIIEHIPTTFTI